MQADDPMGNFFAYKCIIAQKPSPRGWERRYIRMNMYIHMMAWGPAGSFAAPTDRTATHRFPPAARAWGNRPELRNGSSLQGTFPHPRPTGR